MSFFEIDPTLYSMSVDLGQYDLDDNELVFVQLVGGFSDTYDAPADIQNSDVVYAGSAYYVNNGYIIPALQSNPDLTEYCLDTPLYDNSNPDGTYGLDIVVISSGASEITDQDLDVGSTGSATFVDPGGSLTINSLTISLGSSLDISADGSISADNGLDVGGSSSGTLTIDSGATVDSGGQYAFLGSVAGSQGTVTVTGGDSKWTITNELIVANYGDGDLSVEKGGLVESAGPYDTIGQFAGSQGNVTIDGIGSVWDSDGNISVGADGEGALTVTNGGDVEAATGIVVASRTGSGTLLIEGRGLLNSGTGNNAIGADGGTGQVDVTGTNSTWTMGSQLDIGGNSVLNVINSGEVIARAGIQLGSEATISIDSSGSVEIGNAGDATAGMLTIDTSDEASSPAPSLSGAGLISASVENNGVVNVTGAMEIGGAIVGSGHISIGADGALTLDGSVGTEQSVGFSDPTGELVLEDPSEFDGTIMNFHADVDADQSDTVDVIGISANEYTFDYKSGILNLYDDNYGSGNAVVIGSLNFAGLASGSSFALASDGNGGTVLTVGAPTPTLVQLADLSSDVYSNTTEAPYTLLSSQNFSGGLLPGGFRITEYKDDNQIVIAVRGTQPPSGLFSTFNVYQFIKNVVADVSFAGYWADEQLSSYVKAAADFLLSVREANPDDTITLTGHSLGGAIADLLGKASGYTTTTFNAPGAADLIPSLSTQLSSALAATTHIEQAATPIGNSPGASGPITDVRIQGDQVSQVGSSIGTVVTLANTVVSNPVSWLSALSDHLIDTVVSVVQTPTVIAKEAALPLFAGVSEVFGAVETVVSLVFSVTSTKSSISIDPPSATFYDVEGDTGSPEFQTITLPVATNVASYEIRVDQNGVWSTEQTASPGAVFDPGSPFIAFQFTPEDSQGNPFSAGVMVFDATFASTGQFTGSITVPNPVSTWVGGTGDYNTAADWSPEGVPSSADDALIPSGTVTDGQILTLGDSSGSSALLTVDGSGTNLALTFGTAIGEGGLGTLAVANGATIGSASGADIGVDAGSTGNVTVSEGSYLTWSAGTVIVGDLAGSVGSLTINAASTFDTTVAAQTASYIFNIGNKAASDGAAAASGTVTVTGAGALLDLNGNGAIIGENGNGALNILDGGVVKFASSSDASTATASLSLGRAGTGTIDIDGTGSELEIAGGFYAGRATGSSGTINISNDGNLTETLIATGDTTTIGGGGSINGVYADGGTGTLSIATGGSADFGGALTLGANGSSGVGIVSDGTLAIETALTLGAGTTVTGGTGSLTLKDGGVVEIGGAMTVGNTAGTSGTVDIDAGSTLTSSTPSSALTSYLALGNAAGATGTVDVSGTGATLDINGNYLIVGRFGVGTLTIENGATADTGTTKSSNAGALDVALSTGSTGTVDVGGAGVVADGCRLRLHRPWWQWHADSHRIGGGDVGRRVRCSSDRQRRHYGGSRDPLDHGGQRLAAGEQ